MTFHEMEREYDPLSGSYGRGWPVTFDELVVWSRLSIEAGYVPVELPCGDVYANNVPVIGQDGNPTGARWYGFARENDGKQYVVAFEATPSVRDVGPLLV